MISRIWSTKHISADRARKKSNMVSSPGRLTFLLMIELIGYDRKWRFEVRF